MSICRRPLPGDAWFACIVLAAIMLLAFAHTPSSAESGFCGFSLEDLAANDDRTFCGLGNDCFCVEETPAQTPWTRVILGSGLAILGMLMVLRRTRWIAGLLLLAAGCLVEASATPVQSAARSPRVRPLYDVRTCQNNAIEHFHRVTENGERDLTPAERNLTNVKWDARHPAATRTAEPTNTYDCHGFTFLTDNPALTAWINSGAPVETFLADDYTLVAGAKVVGDVAVYRDAGGTPVHTGKVTAVDAGAVTQVESKWGNCGRYRHAPNDCPYPANISYYRKHPCP